MTVLYDFRPEKRDSIGSCARADLAIGAGNRGPLDGSIALGAGARCTEAGEIAIWVEGKPILRVYIDGRIMVGEHQAGRDVDLAPALALLIRKTMEGYA